MIFLPVQAQEASQEALCQLLPEHKPVAAKPTDGVQYLAGIDVNGNPVIAADVGTPLKPIMQPVVIPIEVDLVQYFNLNVPGQVPAAVNLEPTVATMRIHADGRVEYNDQDVSDQAYYLCGKGEKPVQGPEQAPIESGQAASDNLTSDGIIEGQYP